MALVRWLLKWSLIFLGCYCLSALVTYWYYGGYNVQ